MVPNEFKRTTSLRVADAMSLPQQGFESDIGKILHPGSQTSGFIHSPFLNDNAKHIAANVLDRVQKQRRAGTEAGNDRVHGIHSE